MKLKEMYRIGIETGIKNDPRGESAPKEYIADAKKTFDEMNEKEKPFFDKDKLWNPYDDSRIQFGDPDKEIETILTGVDIDTSELLLADRLNEKGHRIDAVLSHHPGGPGMIGLSELMKIQSGLLNTCDVPINIAEDIVIPRAKEVGDRIYPANHYRTANSARLLGIPLMSLHTPADNCVQTFLTNLFNEKKPETIGDLVEVIHNIPEYHLARLKGLPTKIEVGDKERKCGKIVVDMTGGTTGPKEMYKHLANRGVGTIVVMHIPKDYIEEIKKHHINIVNAGHMASDSLGMNHLYDEFERRGINIIPTSGIIRVNAEYRRNFESGITPPPEYF
jgi:putative NIF3 family GTP cyclohydrolase 1 type 2